MDTRLIKAMAIGDGSISIKKLNARLRILHSAKQKDYLLWKRDLLSAAGVTTWYGELMNVVNPYTGKKDLMCWVESASSPALTVLRGLLYPKSEGFKPGVLDDLDELHLAIVFMDDGCKQVNKTVMSTENCKRVRKEVVPYIASFSFALQSFGFTGAEQFKDWLRSRFGLESKVWKQKGQPRVAICRNKDKKMFREIVSPYMCSSMTYKLDGSFEAHIVHRDRLSERAPFGVMRQSELAGNEPQEGESKSLPADQ